MKSKRFLNGLMAIVLAVTTTATMLSGCGGGDEECEHKYRWTESKLPTCSETGLNTGVCGLCGDVSEEIVPIDPDAHTYGDWSVETPTTTATGKAVKVCSSNSSHVLEVTLPVISDSGEGYDSVKQVTIPTAVSEGENKYTLKNDAGDITFSVSVPAKGIESVGDAVEVGVYNASKIRSSSGYSNFSYYAPSFVYATDSVTGKYVKDEKGHYVILRGHFTSATEYVVDDSEDYLVNEKQSTLSQSENNDYFYEFGDNYTHIVDEPNYTERWYSYQEDGSIWGYIRQQGELKQDDTEAYMSGSSFALQYSSNGILGYGVEAFLNSLYEMATLNANGDLVESIEEGENGSTVYSFSFGYVVNDARFAYITTTFTLTDEGTVATMDVYSEAYINKDDKQIQLVAETWEYDENNHAYVYNKAGSHYTDRVHIEQKTIAEAETAGEAVPVNPYSKQALMYSDFNLKYNNKVLDDDSVIEVDANKNFTIALANIQPSTADATVDEIKIYRRTISGDTELPDAITSTDSTPMYAFYSKGSITVRCRVVGEVTLVIKTTYVTKIVNLNVASIAPSSISASLYLYGDTGYTWNTVSSATVYVGQPLTFKATVPELESAYASSAYTARVTSTNKGTATITAVEGSDSNTFVAKATGTYTIVMQSSYSASAPSTTFTVTVETPPAISELVQGEFKTTLKYPKDNIKVVFTNTDETSGTLTVTQSDKTYEVLSYKIENGVLTTQHSGGADCGYTLEVNEAYRLVLKRYVSTIKDYDTGVLISTTTTTTTTTTDAN
jgi:hypothetical protein